MSSLNGRSAERVRETWESRVLAAANGRFAAVAMAVLFNKYAEYMPILLRATFPGFRDVALPAFTGCATVVRTGVIVCDMFDRNRNLRRDTVVYASESELMKDFRDVADKLKLSDAERVALTDAVKRWIVADMRVNHMGEKAVA